MKKTTLLLTCLAVQSLGYADSAPPLVLDTIAFQVSAKQWVSTDTALLSININITLTDADLVQARATVMERLAKIAQGEWHLTQFNRSQDSSGLEKLTVQAQVRVPQQQLTQVYQKAKSVSKPGASYEVAAIEFTPSLDEIQRIRAQLREQLYQKAQEEIGRLNTVYKTQEYSLNNLVFSDAEVQPVAQVKAYRAQASEMTLAVDSAAPNLAVSNELTMTAMVQAASNRKTAK
jgi:hypothetical protein